jgi:predicted SnoaL-like aldol condensation-catalyzing enzyme
MNIAVRMKTNPIGAPNPSRRRLVVAILLAGLPVLSVMAPRPSQAADQTGGADLDATARQAVLAIFRDRDPTAVDRFFSESFVQHDPNLSDGRAGLKAFAAEVATSPQSSVTIYRALVDGDIVMLHSRYEGWPGFAGPVIAFDLFRFAQGRIVEHWGGQELEAPPNPSGHTQVDGPTAVVDRDRTEENRSLVRAFKQIVTVELRFDRVAEFIEGDDYTQHASKIGDGTARMKSRVSEVSKPAASPVLIPRRYVAEGNFVLAIVEARTEPPTANYDLFRVQNGKIAEHWDVLSRIRPRAQWKNANGPF